MNMTIFTIDLLKETNEAFTHGGKFHADDVFSAALLLILHPDLKITRGFKIPSDFTGLVFDIGGGRYDHHQKENELRENQIPYASFGKIWRDFGPDLVGKEEAARFDKSFIQPLDLSDNTGEKNQLASAIDSFNPSWREKENTDIKFMVAVSFAKTILENKIKFIQDKRYAKEIVTAALDQSKHGIVILPSFAPWSDTLIPSPLAKLVIYPSNRGGYQLQEISKSFEDRTPKVPLPKRWAGQEESKLRKEIPGMHFCHSNGFLAAFDTLEDAYSAAKIALQEVPKVRPVFRLLPKFIKRLFH